MIDSIVSHRETVFESLPKEFRVEPVYGSNVGT